MFSSSLESLRPSGRRAASGRQQKRLLPVRCAERGPVSAVLVRAGSPCAPSPAARTRSGTPRRGCRRSRRRLCGGTGRSPPFPPDPGRQRAAPPLRSPVALDATHTGGNSRRDEAACPGVAPASRSLVRSLPSRRPPFFLWRTKKTPWLVRFAEQGPFPAGSLVVLRASRYRIRVPGAGAWTSGSCITVPSTPSPLRRTAYPDLPEPSRQLASDAQNVQNSSAAPISSLPAAGAAQLDCGASRPSLSCSVWVRCAGACIPTLHLHPKYITPNVSCQDSNTPTSGNKRRGAKAPPA